MDFHTRRQITILLAAGLVLAGVGFLVVQRYLPKPTCFDNKKNQNEEEVDCGGSCIPCALKHQKDVEIFWTRFVKSRGGTYDAAAEIRNPNVKLGAAYFRYTFKLFDKTGFLVASREGISFLYPGETIHLTEVGLLTGRIVEKATLDVSDFKWVIADSGPDLIAGNREYNVETDNGGKQSVVKAIITNRTIKDIKGIRVNALVFDDRGNILGVNRTVIDELKANESQPVKFTWPGALADTVSTTLVEARSNAALPQSP